MTAPSRSTLLDAITRTLGGDVRVEVVPIPHDCRDGFLAAYWRRPSAYLASHVRRNISTLAALGDDDLLDGLARQRDDVDVIAINLDDPEKARALFEERGYKLKLLADDGVVSQRYNVTNIPHVVVIDRDGIVREVARGGSINIDAAVKAALD